MQIRQLEALQNMARGNAGTKVIFVPMNLGPMGSASLNSVAQQMSSSAGEDELHGPSSATHAGLISSMANL